jgi:hypothetical protein
MGNPMLFPKNHVHRPNLENLNLWNMHSLTDGSGKNVFCFAWFVVGIAHPTRLRSLKFGLKTAIFAKVKLILYILKKQ